MFSTRSAHGPFSVTGTGERDAALGVDRRRQRVVADAVKTVIGDAAIRHGELDVVGVSGDQALAHVALLGVMVVDTTGKTTELAVERADRLASGDVGTGVRVDDVALNEDGPLPLLSNRHLVLGLLGVDRENDLLSRCRNGLLGRYRTAGRG